MRNMTDLLTSNDRCDPLAIVLHGRIVSTITVELSLNPQRHVSVSAIASYQLIQLGVKYLSQHTFRVKLMHQIKVPNRNNSPFREELPRLILEKMVGYK